MAPRAMILGLKYFKAMMESSGHVPRVLDEDFIYCRNDVATLAWAQGQAVIEYLGRRPAIKSQSLVGNVTATSRFEDM
eukprot:scaffold57250_cov32-Attheya_sp.AAC.1